MSPVEQATFADAEDTERDELVGYLERDQLEVEMDKTLPPARLGRLSRLGCGCCGSSSWRSVGWSSTPSSPGCTEGSCR